MSDTPKTDAVCGWPWGHHGRIESSDLRWSPDGPFVHSEVTRQLERELTVANNWVEHHQNHCDDLIKENARLRMELDASCNAEELRQVREENSRLHVELDAYHNGEQLRQVRAENAALRACVDRTGEANDKLVVENAALRAQDAWLVATFGNREDENQKLRAELEAQAVVNGKGSEREARLLAEVAELRSALEESQQYGRNHANANMKLLSVISRIRRAVDEQSNKSRAMRLEDVGGLCDEALGKKSSP